MNNIDPTLIYVMSTTNIILSVAVIAKAARYLSKHYDLLGRARSAFVIPAAYGLAYFVMQMDWLIRASAANANIGSLRDMAWLFMEFAVLIYMGSVVDTNIRRRVAWYRLDDNQKLQEIKKCAR